MSADVEKAIAYMRSLGRLQHPGACLYYVWLAYKSGGASTDMSARTALQAWEKTEGRHPDDRNPPRGAAVWWGAKRSSSAGDVVISLGGGRVIATDQPRYGVVGEATVAERERLIGRPYLGWSDHIFDAPLALTALAGDTAPKPAPKPKPIPAPVLTAASLEEIMAFKSIAIGYRPDEKTDRIESTALDWEDGATLDLHNTSESYTKSFSDGLTEGGLKILTKGHYDYVLARFAEHQKTMRERERTA